MLVMGSLSLGLHELLTDIFWEDLIEVVIFDQGLSLLGSPFRHDVSGLFKLKFVLLRLSFSEALTLICSGFDWKISILWDLVLETSKSWVRWNINANLTVV